MRAQDLEPRPTDSATAFGARRFARRVKKIVGGLSQGLTEEERPAVADRAVEELKGYRDRWRLNEDEPPWDLAGLPPPSSMRGGRGHDK